MSYVVRTYLNHSSKQAETIVMSEPESPNQTEKSLLRDKIVLLFVVIGIFLLSLLLLQDYAGIIFLAFVASLFALHFLVPDEEDNYGPSRKSSLGRFEKDANFTVVEALQFPAYLMDERGNILFVNKYGKAAFGNLNKGDKIFIRFRNPELRKLIEKSLESKTSLKGEYNEPYPDDRWYSVEISLIRKSAKGAKEPVFLLAFHDLTEAKRTDQMRSDFIANASHELRTPLASLSGYIETIKGPARKDEKAIDRFTDVMLDQAQRMTRLVNDLLSLSRIEMQSHVRPSEMVDLTEVVTTVIDSLKAVASQSKIRIEFENLGKVPVLGDRDELVQVFENLVENACKYGEDGKKVIVALDVNDQTGTILASVKDFGPGIALEHQRRITERFYRVDVERSRAKQGTGLGLAIVKHILNRHGTKLNVQSRPDEGATFLIRFKMHADSMSDMHEET